MNELENPFGPLREPKRHNWIAILAAFVAVVALAGNYWAFRTADRAEQRAATLESQVATLQGQLSALASSISAQGLQLTEASPLDAQVAANLPRYPDSGQDTALGLTLSPVTGAWYPDGKVRTIDPADGTARAWLVWAHWCPYCQQELPIVKAWYESNAANYPHMEIVSITTAMDDSASNPLLPYLQAENFPFPVIIDASGELSTQMGVSAFPFWVFTGPDGTVLGRSPGLLPETQLAAFFEQLEAIGSDAS